MKARAGIRGHELGKGGGSSMKGLKRVRIGLLVMAMLVALLPQTAFAAEEEYTYTVRLYAGNQGVATSFISFTRMR